jgi:hypothetical protein
MANTQAAPMRTNSDITIFNRYIDSATHTEAYQSAVIKAVAWENRKAANVLASGGNISANSARAFIPFARGVNYLKPKVWSARAVKTGKWTIAVDDIVVRGIVTDELSSSFTATALKAKYDDVLVVASVDVMDSGSYNLWHWNVGLK